MDIQILFKYVYNCCSIVLTRVLIAHILMYGFMDTKHTVTKLSDQQSYNNLGNQNMTKVSVEMNLNILFISSVAFDLLTCMLHLEFSL